MTDFDKDIDNYYSKDGGFLTTSYKYPEKYRILQECADILERYEANRLQPAFEKDKKGIWILIHDYRHTMSKILCRIATLEKRLLTK
jgi:hypothetical protein